MAEIVKSKQKSKLYDDKKEIDKKSNKTGVKKVEHEKKGKKSVDNKSIWTRFMIFINGVKSETSKVRWTSKNDMIKYSIATIVFIIFCSIFFYGIDTVFALVQSLFK